MKIHFLVEPQSKAKTMQNLHIAGLVEFYPINSEIYLGISETGNWV
jgi:hypothetical protein